jgi:hypothetical protein
LSVTFSPQADPNEDASKPTTTLVIVII